MSLLLKAFPHGRPRRPRAPGRPRTHPGDRAHGSARRRGAAGRRQRTGPAEAAPPPRPSREHHAAHHAAHRAKAARAHKKKKPRPPRIVGPAARATTRSPRAASSASRTRGKKARQAIRSRVLYTIQSVWGGPRDALRRPAGRQRHDQDRHLVLRRLGRRPGAGRGQEARRQRADRRGQEGQPRPRVVELAAQEARLAACSARTTRRPTPCGASPGSAGVVPRTRSAPPTRSTSSSTTSVPGTCGTITRADVDEPDHVRLQRPVEPGAGDLLPRRLERLLRDLPAVPAEPARRAALPRQAVRLPRRLLLPALRRHARARTPSPRSSTASSPATAPPRAAPAARGSTSSSTPSTATAASGSRGACATCGSTAATSRSSTRWPAGRSCPSCAAAPVVAPSRCASR